MNITENLQRIKQGKDDIIKSLKNKGVEINDNTLINEIPTIIDNAEIGGGGGDTPSQPEIPELVQKYEGASVFRIEVPEDNYEFAINLCNDASTATYDVDWGDGSLESGLTTDEQHHTYTKKGIYDINIYNLSKDITLGGNYNVSIGNSKYKIIYYLFNNSNKNIWSGSYSVNTDYICTDILIGKGIESIGGATFSSYISLKSVVLTEGVITIHQSAFYQCTSLQNIVIPNSVTSINSQSFYKCTSLQNIVIPESVTNFGQYVFGECSSLQSIVIPDGVTSIGDSMFYKCTSLQNIVIPNSVTSIKYNAFQGCTSLQSIVIPDGVTNINMYTFEDCSSLQSIVIPDGVTSIGSNVFNKCYSLQSITCNAMQAPTIQSNSFPSFSNYSKTFLYVPKESTGYDSGNWKTYLIDNGWELRYIEDRVKTPTTLKLKTKNNFFHNLQAIGEANLVDYELIDNEYIYNFDDKITELIQYTFYKEVLEEIELPEGVELLGDSLFYETFKLSTVNIPSTVTSIGKYCFYRTAIKEIIIPEGITLLPDYMCDTCFNLKTVNIPSTVTSIGKRCFTQNSNLRTIISKSIQAPTIQSDTFQSIASSGTRVLRVPEGAEGYDSGNWKTYVVDKGYTLEYVPLSEL